MVQIITNKDTVVVYHNNIKVDKPLPIIEKLIEETNSWKSPMMANILQIVKKND